MLLTAICIIFHQGKRLPQDRHELFQRIVENVVYRGFRVPARIAMHRQELCMIAYSMHTGDGLSLSRTVPLFEASINEVDGTLAKYQEKKLYTQEGFLGVTQTRQRLLSESGLLLPSSGDRASFYHPSIQEHLAAQLFLDREEHNLVDGFVRRASVKEWRHTLSFAFGALLTRSEEPTKAVQLVESLLDRMTATNFRLEVVIADCLEVLRGRKIGLMPESQEKFRAVCIAAIEREVEIKDRHVLGLALGWLGDPRIENDLRTASQAAYVPINAGNYAYQEVRVEFDQAYQLSRYPVTNSQYAIFMANGGYNHEPSCSPEGWQWKVAGKITQPAFWRHPRYNCPNQPVVGVSWYEADVFCRWAGGQLPTEQQWEAAARGTEGRTFPWGSDWEDGICNSYEAGLGENSAAGLFPRSRTPGDGLEDMSGNVWEWCANRFGVGSDRVSRGGSRYDSTLCRAAYRDWYLPDYRGDDLSFRLVLVSSRDELSSGQQAGGGR